MTTHEKLATLTLACLLAWLAGTPLAIAQERPGMMPLPEGRVMLPAQSGFDATVSRVKQAIGQENLMVVTDIDHQMMLSMVGVQTKGMLTIEFFHPRYGKVIFEKNQAAGIEIPLRIVVMEGDMGTMVSYNKPSHIFGKYRGLEALGTELDGVLEKITASVAK